MSDVSERVFERIAASLDDESLVRFFSPDGLARTCDWECEDQWIVSYTTSRVRGGKLGGMFAVFVYEPYGKGSRSGKATQWRRVKRERCDTRREAKARASRYFYEHSPKTAARHGVVK